MMSFYWFPNVIRKQCWDTKNTIKVLIVYFIPFFPANVPEKHLVVKK